MRESVENLVQAITKGDAIETEKAFATAMAEKLAPMLDAHRAEVAQSMFKVQQEEEAVVEENSSEQVETTDQETEVKPE